MQMRCAIDPAAARAIGPAARVAIVVTRSARRAARAAVDVAPVFEMQRALRKFERRDGASPGERRWHACCTQDAGAHRAAFPHHSRKLQP